MKVEGIDRVVIRVRDSKKATEFFADLFETEFSDLGEIKEADIRIATAPLGLEIVEPLTPDGTVAKAIERKGEGLALLVLKVPSLDEASAEMKTRGIREVGREEYSTLRAARFHPADTYGAMIELTEYKAKHPFAVTATTR